MNILKALGGVDFTKYALLPISKYVHWTKTSYFQNVVNLSKNIFGIKLLHAHLQYVCNIPAKYQMNILKALGGVDFTMYALLPTSQYVLWSKIGYVQNAVNLSKIFFGIKLLYAYLKYVCNIPAKYQMNILKALGEVDFTKYALSPISQYVQWYKML